MSKNMMIVGVAACCAVLALLWTVGQQQVVYAAEGPKVILGTMPEGTSTYAVGKTLAHVWNASLPYRVTQQSVQVTGPAFRLLKKGKLDLAITTVWAIHGAYTGENPFWDIWRMDEFAPLPITQLNTGSALRYGFFTTDPTVTSLKDFEGKRVYITQPGAENDIQVKAILKAAGVAYANIIDVPFRQIDEAQQGLQNGDAVGFYWTASPWIQEVSQTRPISVVPISRQVFRELHKLLPGWGFMEAHLQDGEFGLQQGGACLDVPFGMYARADLSEEIVYTLVKTMYQQHQALVSLNPQYLTQWTLERGLLGIGAPIHPGAIRYYQEVGVWTAEKDALNEQVKKMKRRVP